MSGGKLHAELMRLMHTPKYDGFNPVPPRSSRSWMDAGDAEEVRIYAWVLWRTVDLDPDATAGFRKMVRTYFAEDERGTLGVKHIAADLNMKSSNVSAALKRLAEKGRIWIEDGKICLNGNAPNPRLKPKGEDKAKHATVDICTDIKNQTIREYFQQLNEKDKSQRVPEYLKVQKFREEIEADAMAAARAEGQKYEDQYLASIGYATAERPKGRPKKERRNPAVQLTLLRLPPISVQMSNGHSVQNGNGIVYEAEIGSVQIPPSLLPSSALSPSSSLATFRRKIP